MFDKSKYPADWKEISRRIRFERANSRCEQCGVKHGAAIVREPGTDRYWYLDLEEMAGSGMLKDANMNDVPYEDMPDGFDDWKEVRVICLPICRNTSRVRSGHACARSIRRFRQPVNVC